MSLLLQPQTARGGGLCRVSPVCCQYGQVQRSFPVVTGVQDSEDIVLPRQSVPCLPAGGMASWGGQALAVQRHFFPGMREVP